MLRRIDLTIIATIFISFFYWIWSIDTKVDRLEKALIKSNVIKKSMNKKGASDLGNAIAIGLLVLVILYFFFTYLL